MSALAIAPTAGVSEGGPADALGASQRVQQLQALLAQASTGSTASFATALEAASASPGGEGESTSPSAEAEAGPGTTVGENSAASSASATALTAAGLSPAGAEAGALTPYTTSTAYTTPGLSATAGQSAYAPDSAAPPVSAAAPGASSGSSSVYDAAIAQAAERYGIEPALLHGLIQQESGFDPTARSSSGALGLTQLMPATASSLGVSDPLDPQQSIEGGARYLSEMLSRFGGNTADALAAYNAGPGAVSQYGGVPPYAETQAYVSKVLGYAAAYRQTLSPAAPVASPLAASAASSLAPTASSPAAPAAPLA
jgi:soluble lytic murein transglycosylase-like protein